MENKSELEKFIEHEIKMLRVRGYDKILREPLIFENESRKSKHKGVDSKQPDKN